MYLKSISLWAGLLWAGLSQAQQPATVECRIGEKVGKKIHLYKVEDGKKVSVANAVYN